MVINQSSSSKMQTFMEKLGQTALYSEVVIVQAKLDQTISKQPLKLCKDSVNVEVGPLVGRVVAESVESPTEGKMICFHLDIFQWIIANQFLDGIVNPFFSWLGRGRVWKFTLKSKLIENLHLSQVWGEEKIPCSKKSKINPLPR